VKKLVVGAVEQSMFSGKFITAYFEREVWEWHF